MRQRVDPDDVLQEAFIEATRRLEDYEASHPMPIHLWVRFLTVQKLMELHRRHLGADKRDARREVAARAHQATSISIARAIVDTRTPSRSVDRREREQLLRDALDTLAEDDREVLLLRHFERLPVDDCAVVLGLSRSGVKLRHLRAMERLRDILRGLEPSDPGG